MWFPYDDLRLFTLYFLFKVYLRLKPQKNKAIQYDVTKQRKLTIYTPEVAHHKKKKNRSLHVEKSIVRFLKRNIICFWIKSWSTTKNYVAREETHCFFLRDKMRFYLLTEIFVFNFVYLSISLQIPTPFMSKIWKIEYLKLKFFPWMPKIFKTSGRFQWWYLSRMCIYDKTIWYLSIIWKSHLSLEKKPSDKN